MSPSARRFTSIILSAALLVLCVPGIALGSHAGTSPAALGQRTAGGTIGVSTTAKTSYAGVITDADTGDPVPWAWVSFSDPTYDFYAMTDETGHYVLDTGYDWDTGEPAAVVPPGQHELFVDADGYETSSTLSTAVLNSVTTVDFSLTALPEPGTLRVALKNAATSASVGSDYWVSVYQLDEGSFECVDGDGSCASNGIVEFDLAPGTYYLWGVAPGFGAEYYQDVADIKSATPVEVSSGTLTSRTMNLSAVQNATCTVTVTNDAAEPDLPTPLEGIEVDFSMYGPMGEQIWLETPWGETNAAGVFSGTIMPGTYSIHLADFTDEYASEYVHDTIFESQAQRFDVAAGTALSVTEGLAEAASVTGTSFDSNGDPYPVLDENNAVQLWTWDDMNDAWEGTFWAEWNDDGTYDLTGVAPGKYRAESYFYDPLSDNYESVYYNGDTSIDDIDLAQDIVVDAGEELTGIDFHFDSFVEKPDVPVVRVEGTNRYATAIATSQQSFDSADTVVLATGTNFPDALSASALAGAYGGPLLLTNPDTLSPGVATEITRLGATEVVIIGSEDAVSWDVEEQVDAIAGVSVDRVFGDNRYETSAEIAYRVADLTGYVYEAFVVRGDNFADALSASPIAYRQGMPVILTESKRLRPEAAAVIEDLEIENVIIAGSTAAVATNVVTAIEDISPEIYVERIFGADRYATSANLAAWSVEYGYASKMFVGVATGLNFPDALGGGAACGSKSGVLLLTNPTTLSEPAAKFLTQYGTPYTQVQVYGSKYAVSDGVKTAISNALPK